MTPPSPSKIFTATWMGSPLREAVLIGASEIATPTLVSHADNLHRLRLGRFFLTGPAKVSLYSHGAGGGFFAMLASYLLSRTLVPVLV